MQDFLFIIMEKTYFKLKFSEILFIQAEKKYVQIVTTSKSHLILTSISQIERLLPPHLFCRIHRSFIISLEHTNKFNCEFAYVGNEKIPISEQYRSVLKSSLIILTGEATVHKLNDVHTDKMLNDFVRTAGI
jgi:two-component system, LytTR family, response regulator